VLVEAGGSLEQETRRWDDVRGETQLMRIKESAHNYRYFPDPDLLPVKTASILEAARLREPELPWQKRARYVADFGVTDYDAAVLASDLSVAGYFEAAASGAKKPKSGHWLDEFPPMDERVQPKICRHQSRPRPALLCGGLAERRALAGTIWRWAGRNRGNPPWRRAKSFPAWCSRHFSDIARVPAISTKRFEFLQRPACSRCSATMALEAPRGIGCKLGAFLRMQEQFAELLFEFCGVGDLRGTAFSHELSSQ
jgi:hypothetical protein